MLYVLQRDISFLSQHGIMDYSVFIAIQENIQRSQESMNPIYFGSSYIPWRRRFVRFVSSMYNKNENALPIPPIPGKGHKSGDEDSSNTHCDSRELEISHGVADKEMRHKQSLVLKWSPFRGKIEVENMDTRELFHIGIIDIFQR